MNNQLATLCTECTATLQDGLAETKGPDTSGLYCGHNKSCAVVVSTDGQIQYSQISGPVTAEQAKQVMAGIIVELSGGVHDTPGALQ